MATNEIKFLNKRGVNTLVREIKKRTSSIYTIKGSAVYADADYVAKAAAGTAGYESDIDSVGLWQKVGDNWTKITAVQSGWVFDIKNDFKTDEDFVEGSGHNVVAGINIVAVNTALAGEEPVMKWDLLAMGVNLTGYQEKILTAPLSVFDNETPVVYESAEDLPRSETAATATITDLMVAIIGGTSTEAGDVYRASVTPNEADNTKNDITWIALGNQTTVEGALATLGATCPNTPITDAEIEAMFNE